MQFKTLLTAVFFSGSTLASSIFNLNSANTEAQPKYFKLNAHKFTRSNLDNVYYDDVQKKLFKRDDDSEQVSMDLDHERTFYSTEIEIGSPPQKVKVLVDTGSSDLWVVASNNSLCQSGTAGSLNKLRALDDVLGANFAYTASQQLTVQRKPAEEDTTGLTVSFPYFGTDHQSAFTINPTYSLSNVSTGTLTSSPSSTSGSSSGNSSEIDCSIFGTFDPDSSDTFVSNGTSFYITYADSTYARGTWGHDDMVIGDYNVSSLSFAVCDNTDDNLGVLGIGLSGLETTYSGTYTTSSSRYQYENLPLKLKSDGFINMAAYSVYLHSNRSDEDANVLFGAIDHNKYTGDLVSLPIVNPYKSNGYYTPIYTIITLNSINIVDTSSSTEATIGSGAALALLDTGSTLSYAPNDVYSKIMATLDAEFSSSLDEYIMRCSDADNYNINFNFQGKEISVPASSFMVPLTTSSGTKSSYCMVGIMSNGRSPVFLLGANFIRNVYLIHDFENYDMIIGNANHDNDDENIEIFTSTIPNVARTASASAWSTSSQSLTVPSSVETRAYTPSSTEASSSEDTETSESSSTASVSSISSTDSNNGVNGKYKDINLYGFTISFLFFIVSLL